MGGDANRIVVAKGGDRRSLFAVGLPDVADGAKAIGREDELGVIVPGALADLLLVDMERPHLSPRNDLIANLAYCGKASDVDTVFVGGEIVVEGGRLLTSDVRALCREAGERVAEIKQRG